MGLGSCKKVFKSSTDSVGEYAGTCRPYGLLWMDQIEKAAFRCRRKYITLGPLSTDWKRSLGKGTHLEDYTIPGMEKLVERSSLE